MSRLLAVLALLWAGNCCASDWQYVAYSGVAADVISTRYALDKGLEEGNPLLGKRPSNAVLLASGLARAGGVYLCRDNPTALKIISALTFGAATNNVLAARGDRDHAGKGLGAAGFVMLVSIPF